MPQEVSPTPSILTPEGIAQVIIYGGTDIDAKFMQLAVFVYASEGKIFYSLLNNGNYKAQIKW